jgi:hypothetical protein
MKFNIIKRITELLWRVKDGLAGLIGCAAARRQKKYLFAFGE